MNKYVPSDHSARLTALLNPVGTHTHTHIVPALTERAQTTSES